MVWFNSCFESWLEVLTQDYLIVIKIHYCCLISDWITLLHEDPSPLPMDKNYTSVKEFNWLAQLVWGQQLTLEVAKMLGINPDTVIKDQSLGKDQSLYVNAGIEISL